MSKPGNKPVRRLPVYRGRNAGTFQAVDWVPKTRGDCPTERPCVHVRCSHHLYFVEGKARAGRYLPDDTVRPEWLKDMPPSSCALDVADSGPKSSAQVAEILGLDKRRVEQIVKAAMEKLRANRQVELEDSVEDEPSPLGYAQDVRAL